MDAVQENRKRIDRLEDRMELLELPFRYARAIDDRDMPVLANTFCENGVFRHADGTFDVLGRAAIAEFFTNKLAVYGMSIHSPHGQVIQQQSEDRAAGWVDSHAEFVENDVYVSVGLRYEDEYQKEENAWRFAVRTLWYWYFTDWSTLAETAIQTDRRRVHAPYRMADLPERLSTYSAPKTS